MGGKLIRLDKYLADRNLADSRTTAQRYITEGRVSVDGRKILKTSSQISPGANVVIDAPEKEWVSRGAYKLIKGLDCFGVDAAGKICIDIGASTGGFTDVLLSRGAKKVYAVDVGYGQLAWKLRADARVQVLERTNARYLTIDMLGGEKADIIVSDASFISLRLLLNQMETLLKPDGLMVTLVKPQFEAGKEKIGRGVIKDPAIHEEVLSALFAFVRDNTNLTVLDVSFSPIRGPEGNIEFLFLLAFKDTAQNADVLNFARIVEEAHSSVQPHQDKTG